MSTIEALREAALWLHAVHDWPPQTPEGVALLARVDAALAEHDAQAARTERDFDAWFARWYSRWEETSAKEAAAAGWQAALARDDCAIEAAVDAPEP